MDPRLDTHRLTSTILSSMVPDFVESEYPIFIAFLKAYHQWLEQSDKSDGLATRLLTYQQIDHTLDAFVEHFRREYLASLPVDATVSPDRLMVYARELYRARGSAQSFDLLFRLLYGVPVSLYYPREDIFRLSDGRWTVPVSIKAVWVDGITEAFEGRVVRGAVSRAEVQVERVSEYFDGPFHVAELFLTPSTLVGTFQVGETITNTTGTALSTELYGVITDITITNAGTDYAVGDSVVIADGLQGGGGVSAEAKIRRIGIEGLTGITIDSPGEGYVVGDAVVFGNGGTGGTGAVAAVSEVSPGNILLEDGDFIEVNDAQGIPYRLQHEQIDYYVESLLLSDFADVELFGANYDTPSNHALAGADSTTALSVTNNGTLTPFLVDGIRTAYGRIERIALTNGGSGYQSLPSVSVTNPTSIALEAATGLDLYSPASIRATAGAGQVKAVQMTNFGVGYLSAPTVSFPTGDGSAEGTAVVGTLCSYAGRYSGTYGQLSSDKYIQDGRYYQQFSYVIKAEKSLDDYRNIVKKLLHPAGSIFFGNFVAVLEANVAIASGSDGVYSRTVSDSTSQFNLPTLSIGAEGISFFENLEVLSGGGAANTEAAGNYAITNPSPYEAAILRDRPKGYWRLGESSGSVATDLTGNGYHGSYVGGVTLGATGALADGTTGVTLNGTTGRVEVSDGSAFAFQSGFSVEVWAATSNTATRTLVAKSRSSNRGWSLYTRSAGGYQFTADVTGTAELAFSVSTPPAGYENGQYHHIVATWDGTTNVGGVKVYVDGVIKAQGQSTGNTLYSATSSQPLVFGMRSEGGDLFYNGSLDEVAIYDYVLSQEQVSRHYALRAYGINGYAGVFDAANRIAAGPHTEDLIYYWHVTPITDFPGLGEAIEDWVPTDQGLVVAAG